LRARISATITAPLKTSQATRQDSRLAASKDSGFYCIAVFFL
jgi:hypothetical protein